MKKFEIYNKNFLEIKSKVIRNHVLDMTNIGKSSHVGSALSIVDILVYLYGFFLNHYPKAPKNHDRDRFILSKGHAGAALYATLSEFEYFPSTLLKTHYQNGSNLSGHVSHKGIPGVEVSTGSLGHGLPIAVGMALSAKLRNQKHQIYVLLSDGELDEGSNWESFLFASHHGLANLTAIIDYNKLQSLDTVENTLSLEPLDQKFLSFGWNVIKTSGHDFFQINDSFQDAYRSEKPSIIIADTIKGKGVSFMENSVLWHYRSPQGKEYKNAKKELQNDC